ncbi:MAG: 3-methyl-2-oxobutanoate hydroxymethyltransferase [Candidatus Tectomicrobia bacterium]|nr:3-methyl-2-oxobutanoate hydroxymethyltransferase [Candidatus Tectomicrobia bacterium]
MRRDKVTVTKILKMKAAGERISMITAYDQPFARLFDDAGVDVLLVGDSVGNVMLGYDTTLPVSMEEMLHHTKAVARANPRAMVAADLPFLSYQCSVPEAVRNAGLFLKEGGAEAVKLEGGVAVREQIAAICAAGIPVVGHVGLTPQSVHQLGGYKVQGKTSSAAERIVEDARAIEEAGAFCVVLECVPVKLAKTLTEMLLIPTIGIGAGPYCDGQVLVMHDLLGLNPDFTPRFVKRYAQLHTIVREAVAAYSREVKEGSFPSLEHSFND